MTDEQKRKYRNEHIPHRLAHLENLVWACHAIETYRADNPLPRATIMVTRDDGRGERVEYNAFWGVTNSFFDIGVVTCRVLLDFLAGRKKAANPRPDDVFFECVFGEMQEANWQEAARRLRVEQNELDGATKAVSVMASKAVAHLTRGHRRERDVGKARLCALAILYIFDKYAYGGAMPCLLLCDGKPIWEQELEEFVRTRATTGNAISPEAARVTSAAAPAIVTRMGQAPTRAEAQSARSWRQTVLNRFGSLLGWRKV